MLNQITERRFRANPAFQLMAYDRLTPEGQAQLQPLVNSADFYGVLVNGAITKAVDPETALLVLTLQEPGVLPTYVRHRFGRTTNQAIARLVLDDILQISEGEQFLSGPAAHAIVYAPRAARQANSHPLVQLTQNALRYASKLPPMAHGELAHRLYIYNTMPRTAQWQQRLASPTAVATWLGVNGWMDNTWRRVDGDGTQGWMSWRNLRVEQRALPYKLYISPQPQQLAQVFRPIVEALGKQGVATFKIGKDVNGILRPDKMVAYLNDFEHLAATAQALQAVLAGCPAQGVPFSAPIDKQGIVSWGMDPPNAAQVFAGDKGESWRYWLAQQLAAGLQTAQLDAPAIEPWQYALDRLELDGIDTERWIPQQAMWDGYLAQD